MCRVHLYHTKDAVIDYALQYYEKLGSQVDCILLDGENNFIAWGKEEKVALVALNCEVKAIAEKLSKGGITVFDLFITDLFGSVDSHPLKVENTLPRLDRLEIEIHKRCNLNCRGCSHYSNLIQGSGIVDIEEFRDELVQLKKYYWGIETLRLMGGEPLLAKNFTEYVVIARNLFPDADISLVTNGLLVPNMSTGQFKELKKCNCRIVISNYIPTQEKLPIIKEILDSNDVEYNVGPPIKRFYKSFLRRPNDTPDASYKHCIFSNCHALYKGKLSMCGLELYSHRFNETFGESLPEDGSIDLYTTTLTGWQIDKRLHSAQNICRYCHTAYIPIKWKTSLRTEAKVEDYYVDETFYQKKMMPIARKIMMPFVRHAYSSYVRKNNKIGEK